MFRFRKGRLDISIDCNPKDCDIDMVGVQNLGRLTLDQATAAGYCIVGSALCSMLRIVSPKCVNNYLQPPRPPLLLEASLL